MKLAKDHIVCGICRDIIPEKKSKQFVDYISWGSFSGTCHYDKCCKTHKLNKDKTVPGRHYA